MNRFRAIFELFTIMMMIKHDPAFDRLFDQFLDGIEDNFPDKTVQKGCKKIRKIFNVPDNDDE